MMRYLATLSAAVLAAGCSTDLRSLGTLTPNNDGTYTWRTFADAAFPNSDERAEAARRAELGKVLAMNDACVDGHSVENRQATMRVDGALGDIYDIFYTVRCN